MTGLQLATLTGLVLATSGVAFVWWAVPGVPRLNAALDGLHGSGMQALGPAADMQDRLGSWSERVVPATLWHAPNQDLALLRRTAASFHGERLMLAGIGLVFPPLLSAILLLAGVGPPLQIPVMASLIAAIGLFWLPSLTVRSQAAAVRQEFTHALTAYIDLVAMERRAGSGARQALENAARVGRGSWVFARIEAALAESAVDGRRPWDAFHAVASELGLSSLDDLANIMALAEEQSMPVYQALLDHNRGLRTALLTAEHAKANALTERLTVPTTVLVAVFVVIVIGPQIAAMLTG